MVRWPLPPLRGRVGAERRSPVAALVLVRCPDRGVARSAACGERVARTRTRRGARRSRRRRQPTPTKSSPTCWSKT
eukprot:7382580-Prymnesium_polylepis.2